MEQPNDIQILKTGDDYEVMMTTNGKVHIVIDIHVLMNLAQGSQNIRNQFNKVCNSIKLLDRLSNSHHDLIQDLASLVSKAQQGRI